MQNFIFIVDKNRKLTAFVQSSFNRDWKSHDLHEWNLQNIFPFSSFLKLIKSFLCENIWVVFLNLNEEIFY